MGHYLKFIGFILMPFEYTGQLCCAAIVKKDPCSDNPMAAGDYLFSQIRKKYTQAIKNNCSGILNQR